MDSSNLSAIKALANGYMKMGEYENAFSNFEKALVLAPNDLSITIQIVEVLKG